MSHDKNVKLEPESLQVDQTATPETGIATWRKSSDSGKSFPSGKFSSILVLFQWRGSYNIENVSKDISIFFKGVGRGEDHILLQTEEQHQDPQNLKADRLKRDAWWKRKHAATVDSFAYRIVRHNTYFSANNARHVLKNLLLIIFWNVFEKSR